MGFPPVGGVGDLAAGAWAKAEPAVSNRLAIPAAFAEAKKVVRILIICEILVKQCVMFLNKKDR
jgi:hypothetical protein